MRTEHARSQARLKDKGGEYSGSMQLGLKCSAPTSTFYVHIRFGKKNRCWALTKNYNLQHISCTSSNIGGRRTMAATDAARRVARKRP